MSCYYMMAFVLGFDDLILRFDDSWDWGEMQP